MNDSDQYRKIAAELSNTNHDEELWFKCLTEAKGNYETASVLHDKYVLEELNDHDGQSRNDINSSKKLEQFSLSAQRIIKFFGWSILIITLVILVIVFVNF